MSSSFLRVLEEIHNRLPDPGLLESALVVYPEVAQQGQHLLNQGYILSPFLQGRILMTQKDKRDKFRKNYEELILSRGTYVQQGLRVFA